MRATNATRMIMLAGSNSSSFSIKMTFTLSRRALSLMAQTILSSKANGDSVKIVHSSESLMLEGPSLAGDPTMSSMERHLRFMKVSLSVKNKYFRIMLRSVTTKAQI